MIVIRYGFKPQVVIMVPPQPLRKMLQSNAGNTLQQRASGGVETRKGETRSFKGSAMQPQKLTLRRGQGRYGGMAATDNRSEQKSRTHWGLPQH